ncbi:MAG: tetratricopeptide repeat protein [Bdellovibrionales bacterium]|nr:tetratricopeptide repeat protein [Bdellovibrionales bacterium]
MAKTLAIALFLSATGAFANGDASDDFQSIQIHTFKTHSRLVFRLDESISLDWKDVRGGFEVLLKSWWLTDLGAPVGGESEWAKEYAKRLVDDRVKSVEFIETPKGVKMVGQWRFPEGKDRPVDPSMEKFDYREKGPYRYVVDFWPKKGQTIGELEAWKAREKRLAEAKKMEDERHARQNRKIAAIQRKAEAEDLGRFCRQPLNQDTEVVLPFAPVHERFDFSRWFPTQVADTDYEFIEPKSAARDAQYVRLAHELYRQGRPALVIRTSEFFQTEHPMSSYTELMLFLKGNAQVKLRHVEDAELTFREILKSRKPTPITLRAGLFVALRAHERGNHLQALELFTRLLQDNPSSKYTWAFHMGAAEALYNLRQTERASKEFQWVVLNGPDPAARSEAAMRMGDIYLERQQYERALATYFQGIRRFPVEAKKYPAIHLNRAETLYWLEDYARAEEAFRTFLNEYETFPEGWRATYRLGEILSRGKNVTLEKSPGRDFWYQTINRFPFSPGATLARLRLLPCGDHGGFTLESAEKFLNRQAAEFNGSGGVMMDKYNDLRSMARVQAYAALAPAEVTTDIALSELERPLKPISKDRITHIASAVFRKAILKMIDSGKKFDALKFYEKRENRIVKSEVDPDYIVKLSLIASDMGFGSLGAKLSSAYANSLTDWSKKGRAIAHEGESADFEQKIKKAERVFADAKALWMLIAADVRTSASSAKSKEPTEEQINRVVEMISEVPVESEYSFEKEIILGLAAEKLGKPVAALDHAMKAQLLIPKTAKPSTQEDAARIDFWIASLQAKTDQNRVAVEGIRRARKNFRKPASTAGIDCTTRTLGVSAVPNELQLVVLEGEILEKLGRLAEAASAYQTAIEAGLGGNHILYQYARVLGATGTQTDATESRKILEKVAKSETDDFWRKLARESIAGKGNE